jgi:transcription elongation GreA/GreB family factor
MMKVQREEIIEALRKYESEGFNTDNADYDALEQAIVEEYDSGQKGSIKDIIEDLNGSIGLDVFGIVESE